MEELNGDSCREDDVDDGLTTDDLLLSTPTMGDHTLLLFEKSTAEPKCNLQEGARHRFL